MTDPMKYDDTSAGRKATPVYSGVVRYFPAALALVSKVSKFGSDKHGTNMQHKRGVSADHGDCIVRHQTDPRAVDPDSGLEHACAVAWRALAQLQEIAEKHHGWPVAPAALLPAAPLPDPKNPKVGDLFRCDEALEIDRGLYASGVFRVQEVLHHTDPRNYGSDKTDVRMVGAHYVMRTRFTCWEPVASDYTGLVYGE